MRRKIQKDHLREKVGSSNSHLSAVKLHIANDDLQFFTSHVTSPGFVDLTPMVTGKSTPSKLGKHGINGDGTFTGRPEFFYELLPAIKEKFSLMANKSATGAMHTLMKLWQLLDIVEQKIPSMPRVVSVSQIVDLHYQSMKDLRIDRHQFYLITFLINTTRHGLGLRQFYWEAPERPAQKRFIPPAWESTVLRHSLRHAWYAVYDRWERTLPLVNMNDEDAAKLPSEEQVNRKNYIRYLKACASSDKPFPTSKELRQGITTLKSFYEAEFSFYRMYKGFFPLSEDIRVAFHHCLATTGWNPSVLLAIDVGGPHLEAHPMDPNRYVLRSEKLRAGGTEQITEGLFKSQSSAGFIIQNIIFRTAPLRAMLRIELAEMNEKLKKANENNEKRKILKRINELKQGLNSAWLYISGNGRSISWLNEKTYLRASVKTVSSFIRFFIDEINKRQPAGKQLHGIDASDLRDVYASYIYRASGGSIFAVMKALEHRSINSTTIYLTNTLQEEEHRKLLLILEAALFDGLRKKELVDPTILAKISQDGIVTPGERERLVNYRGLLKTSMGTRCRDPHNPPKRIDPRFVPDGKNMCSVQRCLLCIEHAVITSESLSSICKRRVLLARIQSGMSVTAWLESTFPEELRNIDLALLAFEKCDIDKYMQHWEEKPEAKRFIEVFSN